MKRRLAAESSHEKREDEEPDHVHDHLTAEDKRIIQKLRVNLGHPSNYELSKALRLARARNAVWRHVKDDFKCDICERNKKPKSARPAILPKTFEPCRTVGLDVVFFPGLDVRQVRPVLNMVDWATGYQMLEPLDNTQSSHIWEKFYGTWVRTFSVPEVVITDQGREFGKELAEKVSQAGALHRVIGARAPWQQARTERHGGVAKEVFIKLRESMLPTNDSEWRMCVHAVEAAKNRLYNRPGFSPAQRQFGYNMRLPGSLGSDDVYELLIHSSTDDMRRVMEIRNTAMQEYLKHVTCRAVAKAQLARGRGSQEFKIGDVIYVYRVPLQRKRMKSEVDFEDREGRRATWVGPGVVVMVEGANAWLSIRGELWKCALEQLRHATPEEKEARSLLEGDFEELRVEMTRKASKRGFKDITQWDRPPPMVDEDDELPIRPHQRPRLGTEMEPEEEAGRESEYTPTNPAINEEEAPLTEPEIVEQAVESNRRRTVQCFGDGSIQEEKENWRDVKKVAERRTLKGPVRWWVGYTEFQLRKVPPEAELTLMVKRGSDEVREEDIPTEEWEQWRISDGAEWSKVEATGAVKALTLEESCDVAQQLHDAGISSRILPSRMVRRWKPSEQPGIPPTRKSRWCVRGDHDPDLLQLDRHAPTVTTATLSVVLQIAASSGWKAAVGDLKNAFMQSDKLVRPAGRLFCKQPRGGLPGLQEGQLIEILAGAYRLGDAPAHWRKSLKKALFQGGFQQSSMDPCVFKSFKDGKLRGLLAVEVDDLFGAGDEHFFQQMEALRQRFDFGKFARLEEEKAGVGFNGRRIKQEGNEFLIDMEKFVSERLNPVKLATGRATKVKEDATNEEKELVRAAVGSLTWAAKEGRPDAAAAASLTASSMNELKVQDIVDLNKAINQVRENAKLALRIQAIPMADLCWGVVTDASYANVSKGKSQGAYAVLAMDKKVLSTGAGKCNILHWRSGKIHRIVNSTLAAETQALSRGLEFTTEAFDMRRWEESLRQQRLSALVSESSERALAENISIVDAKSLYDHLSRETVGTTNDKRTALEMQIIRQTLAETRTQIKGATPQDDRGQPDKTSWKCDSVVAAFARRRAAINGCN
ncbi:Retrovirus-related Pol polyprotein from transposon RE2 (Retro element 2) (AtRE2) [Includes: Protease RE2 [Durusdinium trenchii]|uniref:Retrovirus-related Pol polyprotein from transposon RE2 (Retro element 2) (AtRE2) n=1 Tax=Durusdinium trenchii TaxID=1381693 RepID=A0ABP0S997_9DINO